MKITACVPLVIYLIMQGLSLVFYFASGESAKQSSASFLLSLVISIFIAYLYYWLCSKKKYNIAWLLLIVPMIITIWMFTLYYKIFIL